MDAQERYQAWVEEQIAAWIVRRHLGRLEGRPLPPREPYMNRCKCGEPEDSPIHVSRYVTGLSGHRFDPEEPLTLSHCGESFEQAVEAAKEVAIAREFVFDGPVTFDRSHPLTHTEREHWTRYSGCGVDEDRMPTVAARAAEMLRELEAEPAPPIIF